MTQHGIKIQDPNFEIRVQESFNQQSFMKFIGAKLQDIALGYCEIVLPFKPEITQQNEFFHAGVISTIADTAGGYAAYSYMAHDSDILTVEFKINFLRPGVGDKLIAKASVVKYGKTLSICKCEVFTHNNDQEVLCAALQMTLMEVKRAN
ncbi:MAG: PaaI family thioesterase [Candidatus Heimdallarchaeota archaeon]|nr:PaaI family thioesterase [Candidatus Heimdallarchaeota archaeon]